MKDVTQIIRSFGGTSAFCRFFDVPKPTANTWRRRNYFPPERDVELIEEADRRKIRLTYEHLAKIRKQPDQR